MQGAVVVLQLIIEDEEAMEEGATVLPMAHQAEGVDTAHRRMEEAATVPAAVVTGRHPMGEGVTVPVEAMVRVR